MALKFNRHISIALIGLNIIGTLREVEVWRYELVYPKKIVPLDSLGAVVIYGDYPDGNGDLTSGTTIYPMDDSYYDNFPAIKEYTERHNIPYQKLQ